jgi:geranylgeranyl pyrophosphate synthase
VNARPRSRARAESRLAALVDEALAPARLEARAQAQDWPAVVRDLASPALPRGFWERALGEVARDILARPSRQFRARLAELAWRIGGGQGEPPRLLGAIVELIHAGSLIVDDIEDGSAERRGAPSAHVTYGMPRALNTANWMYFWALELVDRLEPTAPLVRERMYRALVRAMSDCHLGQGLDLTLAIGWLPQAEVARAVATSTMLKTGALMGLAARLGAIAAGATPEREEALARFGRRLGVGLQMLDDFGNLNADAEGNAKKALEDVRNGTPTWPWALASLALDPAAFTELQDGARAISRGEDRDDTRARAVAAGLRLGVGPAGRREAHRYLADALDRLRAALGGDARAELAQVASEIARLEVSYG